MTWFSTSSEQGLPGDRLEALWSRDGALGVPGAHNALAGILAKDAGFEALYLSGGALSASLGLPDLGMMTTEELMLFVKVITRSTDLPLIVDGDTGYGEALNVMRLIQDLEAAGAAGIQLEDQILPKKCGHLSNKLLNDPESMAAKIAAARRARKHLRIIARTDAAASEGLEGAIARAKLYVEAGADVIFPEALTTAEEMRAFNAAIDAPTLANMTEFGRTPYLSQSEFADLGFKIVIWPVTSLRCEAGAMRDLYTHLAEHRGQGGYLDKLMTRKDIYDAIGYHDYEALDNTIAQSVVPEDGRDG
jgi:methylisocitrate lyase